MTTMTIVVVESGDKRDKNIGGYLSHTTMWKLLQAACALCDIGGRVLQAVREECATAAAEGVWKQDPSQGSRG